VAACENAARAYRELAKTLEAQGLTAPALRYRRRQHQLDRAALIRDFKMGQWLFSCALNLVSGYGDRPLRALGVYLTVISAFAVICFGITNFGGTNFTSASPPLQWYAAAVLSLSSFHGRGFFPSIINLGDPVARVAAVEAVFGLFIELVLIATFTRRLFERYGKGAHHERAAEPDSDRRASNNECMPASRGGGHPLGRPNQRGTAGGVAGLPRPLGGGDRARCAQGAIRPDTRVPVGL
jgi:hypothetical protein